MGEGEKKESEDGQVASCCTTAASVVRHDGKRQHQRDRSRQDSDSSHRDTLRPSSVRHHRPAVPSTRQHGAEIGQLRLAPGRVRTAVRRRARSGHPGGGRRMLKRRRTPLRSAANCGKSIRAAVNHSVSGHQSNVDGHLKFNRTDFRNYITPQIARIAFFNTFTGFSKTQLTNFCKATH